MRRYHFHHSMPEPLTVEYPLTDCDCAACEPYRPSAPRRLDAAAIARLTFGGLLIGHLIAIAIWGPATVLHVLIANLTGARL